jgi:hypothetical protein
MCGRFTVKERDRTEVGAMLQQKRPSESIVKKENPKMLIVSEFEQRRQTFGWLAATPKIGSHRLSRYDLVRLPTSQRHNGQSAPHFVG